ncbi:GIY-YIG nuclease family protein [Streptomyces zaomyceticus]|uniref:GIY-YIG nuclease family protein n=1 Tax=Streptomyces zaomyceticus TaxID=68286 RepID=UPI002E1609E9|nr:GIY-YIG nuclease family protein [Streptomyces zaomyceticus]
MAQPGVQAKGTDETAVYRLYDAVNRLLYVGMGRNPMGRWASHADKHPWWQEVVRYEVTWYPTRIEAAAEERRALKEDDTVHNIHSTERHGLVTGAGVRAELKARREFEARTAQATAPAAE